VIVVVVVALLALLAVSLRRRSAGHRRGVAEGIRTEASGQVRDVRRAQHAASASEADAELARARAEEAELRAEEARRTADQHQAGYEDHLREADRIDPDVDEQAVDYSGERPPTRPNA
jgi:hypothetical protein